MASTGSSGISSATIDWTKAEAVGAAGMLFWGHQFWFKCNQAPISPEGPLLGASVLFLDVLEGCPSDPPQSAATCDFNRMISFTISMLKFQVNSPTFNSHLEWIDNPQALHVLPCLLRPHIMDLNIYLLVSDGSKPQSWRTHLAVTTLSGNWKRCTLKCMWLGGTLVIYWFLAKCDGREKITQTSKYIQYYVNFGIQNALRCRIKYDLMLGFQISLQRIASPSACS